MRIAMVVLAVLAGDAAADTVRFDPESRLFDRIIPSSAEFTLEIAVPGTELVRGELEVWPAPGRPDRGQDKGKDRGKDRGRCTAPISDRQHHKLAMTASGADAERVLRANVPPLQVNTQFCFEVRITRGLDETRAVGFSTQVAAEVMLDLPWDTECRNLGKLRTELAASIGKSIDDFTRQEVSSTRIAARADRTVALASDKSVRDAAASSAAAAIVSGMDLRSLCDTLLEAAAAIKAGAGQQKLATAAWLQAHGAVAPSAAGPALVASHPVKARLPPWISGNPPNVEIRRFAAVADQDAILRPAAQALEPLAPQLAELLRSLGEAEAAEKKALRKAYADELGKLPPQPAVVYYVAGGQLLPIKLDELFRVAARPGEAAEALNARVAEHRRIVLENIDLLKRQLAALMVDDPNARPWFLALEALHVADLAYQAANAEMKAKLDARDAARNAIGDSLKRRLASPDVRALVVSVSAIQSEQRLIAPETEAGASSVSPDVGVLLALPFYAGVDRNGWEPWLVPYAGVNIYRSRVDRVVPFDQLVGSFARQRVSVTIGALLTRPKLNGEGISTPFLDSGVVPVAAVGVRLSSFTRASLGGFLFDYQDANPVSDKKHKGGAIWFGVSIDADVWAAIQGKAFR